MSAASRRIAALGVHLGTASAAGSSDQSTLVEERQSQAVDTDELAALLMGGRDLLASRRALATQLARDPVLGRNGERFDMSRTEKLQLTAEAAARLIEMMRGDPTPEQRSRRERLVAVGFPSAHSRVSNHLDLFLPTLRGLASPEQAREWVPLAEDFRILGCFCMTEVGHGSFVRGIETTATFVPGAGLEGDGEFEIHSPTPTAAKCWIGSAGASATHAVVFAQVVVAGESVGVGALVVQLRDMRSGVPLPGVCIRNMGPKMGRDGLDNGLVLFSHIRVPRRALLSRHLEVRADGSVRHPAIPQLAFAALIGGRAMMIEASAGYLAVAATIAYRYACVRRQFPAPEPPKARGEGPGPAAAPAARTGPPSWLAEEHRAHAAPKERLLITIPLHIRRILTHAVQSYSLWAASEAAWALVHRASAGAARGDVEPVKAAHLATSALKAEATWITHHGIDHLRQTCGGHGYSGLSALPGLFADFAVMPSWEGDNHVLLLQVAASIAKRSVEDLPLPDGEAVEAPGADAIPRLLAHLEAATAGGVPDPDGCLEAAQQALRLVGWMELAACEATQQGAKARMQAALVAGGREAAHAAFEADAPAHVSAARCYARAFLVLAHASWLGGPLVRSLSSRGRRAMARCGAIAATSFLETSMGTVAPALRVPASAADALAQALTAACVRARSVGLALVEAWDHSDWTLRSALAPRDGRVYREYIGAIADGDPTCGAADYWPQTFGRVLAAARQPQSQPSLGEAVAAAGGARRE